VVTVCVLDYNSRAYNLLISSIASPLWKFIVGLSTIKSKMEKHSDAKHPEHINKLASFFNRQTRQATEKHVPLIKFRMTKKLSELTKLH